MIDERLSLTCVVASKVYKTFFDAAAHAGSTFGEIALRSLLVVKIFVCVHMRLMTRT